MINQAQKSLNVQYTSGEFKDPSGDSLSKNNIPSLFDISVTMPSDLAQKYGKAIVVFDLFLYFKRLYFVDPSATDKTDKPMGRERSRPSRWQDVDPVEKVSPLQEQQKQVPLNFGTNLGDKDMRFSA